MKASGLTTRLMVLVVMLMSMEPCMKESGKMTFNMERVLRPGLMNLATMETTNLDANME